MNILIQYNSDLFDNNLFDNDLVTHIHQATMVLNSLRLARHIASFI